MKPKYDLISIGDCTIDAFVRLHDASVHCDLDDRNCQLCISYADKVPYESLKVVPAVGNASNLAVGSARLGLKTAALTAIGDDIFGKQILDVYSKEKVGQNLVKVNRGMQTNYHFVLNYKAERTILVKHQAYSYPDVSKIGNTEWIYFSSMGENSLPFHKKLGKYLSRHKNIKMGFNPGTFQLKMGAQKIREIYRHTYFLSVNREEAQRILKHETENMKRLFKGLHKLGAKVILISDGPKGSYLSDGKAQYYMSIYPDPKPPLERTGAGDATSTAFMAALVYGKTPLEAVRWAPVNSMNVVQYVGAQEGLLTKRRLLGLLRKAPGNYYPRKI